MPAARKHGEGHVKTPEYRTWSGMCSRCYDPNGQKYHLYGGRGITVCDRWLGAEGFANFLEDMGRRPLDGKWSIDRIDNNKGYSPENCRWATPTQQRNNQRPRLNLLTRGFCLTGHEVAKTGFYLQNKQPMCSECRRIRDQATRDRATAKRRLLTAG